jgi:membrane-bound serine protease (ClpP class)
MLRLSLEIVLVKVTIFRFMRFSRTWVRFSARLALAAGLVGGAVASLAAPAPEVSGKRVVVIPVEREVDHGLYAFLKRATAEALAEKPDYIVYKVNTYGGELHSAFEITDLLLSVKGCSTYVYVEQKAISAGALISLACNRMAMGDGTTIGDCAPITQGEDGIVMLGEKIQSPLRAKFRNLAERNGYPALLSQAMVTADMGAVAAYPKDTAAPVQYFTVDQWENLSDARQAAFREHKVVVREGELLTFTDREAAAYGFSQGSFPDFDAFLKHKNWTVVKTLSTNWSEDMVRWLGRIAPLLMLLGFGALYLELKTPGLSVFGALGAVCLALAFGSKYAVGLANHTELLLLIAGFALFLVEIYLLPGTFIAGGLGLVLMIVALTLSLQGFDLPDSSMPWELRTLLDNLAMTLGMATLAIFVPLLAARFFGNRLAARAGLVSASTLAGARVEAPAGFDLEPGTVGTARTPLRPAGKAEFSGRVVEATTRGEFLEAGRKVEVVRLHENRLVVRLHGDGGESA